MVLEHLLPETVLERKGWTGFVLAVIYSTLAILIARFLFGANQGLASVVFLSIFLVPYFAKLLRDEEQQEEGDFRKGFWGLLQDNKDMFIVYLSVFLGVYLTYMAYSFLAPFFGWDVASVFREQLSLEAIRGGVTFDAGTFVSIVANNWWVLLACFVVALIAGDGAIFFIAWNASTWGTIFGYRAVQAAMFDGTGFTGALAALAIIVLVTLPHLLLEGGAYILAALAGGVLSDEVIGKIDDVKSFVVYFLFAVVGYFVLYAVIKALASTVLARGLLAIGLAFGILWGMGLLFEDERHQRIFRYNYVLLLCAVGLFIVGAFVETLVLANVVSLQDVYFKAMFAMR